VWNPSRRNRNIGKTQGGRVKDGRAIEKASRVFTNDVWRTLSEQDSQNGFVILTENPSRDYYHPCSPAEVSAVVHRLPKKLTRHLRAIVLRRPTRQDEERLVQARLRFSCVILNAFPKSNQLDWGTKQPSEADRRHYASWCDNWSLEDGRWTQAWAPEQAKRYYLYHLLLHEIGHIHQPSFSSRRRRESFAEDFALEWARKLKILK
jgi:hypothetical protein